MRNRRKSSETDPLGGDTGSGVDPCPRRTTHALLLRHVLKWGVGGAIGGGVFALIEHLGPDLLGRPVLRWVFLYTLLGAAVGGAWYAVRWWVDTRAALSRREAVLVSGLAAGMLFGGAALFVGTLKRGIGADPLFLLQLPWKTGLGGFVGGAVGGSLGRLLLER